MAPPKAGFGKREDRPMPPWMRPEADTARQKPRRRWIMKRDRTPPRHEEPAPRRPGNAAPPTQKAPMIEPLIETAPDEFIRALPGTRAAHSSQPPLAAAAGPPTDRGPAPAASRPKAAAVGNEPAYELPETEFAPKSGSQRKAEPRYAAEPDPEHETQYEEAQHEPEYATEYEPEPQPEYEPEYEPEPDPRHQHRQTHQPSARSRNSRETAVDDSATRWSRHGVPPAETTEIASIGPAEVPAEVAAAEWTGGGPPPEVVKPSRRIPAWL
ncbi:MAG: hypothetical protein K2Y05_11845, partial [Hyphomicrobiaceae bacterium]|nr:hypothetical protein [Hyphomicrobiaceae bacterium]